MYIIDNFKNGSVYQSIDKNLIGFQIKNTSDIGEMSIYDKYLSNNGVYFILCYKEITGTYDLYIGETSNFKRRLSEHIDWISHYEFYTVYFFTTYNNILNKSVCYEIETEFINLYRKVNLLNIDRKTPSQNLNTIDSKIKNFFIKEISEMIDFNNLLLKSVDRINDDFSKTDYLSFLDIEEVINRSNKTVKNKISYTIDDDIILFKKSIIKLNRVPETKTQFIKELLNSESFKNNITLEGQMIVLKKDVILNIKDYPAFWQILNN